MCEKIMKEAAESAIGMQGPPKKGMTGSMMRCCSNLSEE
jgi:hypothetical protein